MPEKRRGKPGWQAAGAASARFSICSGAPGAATEALLSGDGKSNDPIYGDRWRNGEAISTAFVDSAVNHIVSRRFVKKLQMHWTERSSHHLLQIRTRVLNSKRRVGKRRWHVGILAWLLASASQRSWRSGRARAASRSRRPTAGRAHSCGGALVAAPVQTSWRSRQEPAGARRRAESCCR